MALTWVKIGNLKGPMGPAGDPAAGYIPLSRGQVPEGDDLNTYRLRTNVGAYSILSTGQYVNAPVIDYAGVFEVFVGSGNNYSVVQRITTQASMWWREAIDHGMGQWGSWKRVATADDLLSSGGEAMSPTTIAYSESADGKVTYVHGDPDHRLARGVASITKMFNVWTARKYLTDAELDDTATVEAGDLSESPHLKVGDIVSFRDLCYTAMVNSDSTAPSVLARTIGAKIAPGSTTPRTVFLAAMEAEAERLGYRGAKFPMVTSAGQVSARQVVDMFRRFRADPQLRPMPATLTHTVTIVGGPDPRTYSVAHTISPNGAVPLPEFRAGKTGSTNGMEHVVVEWRHPDGTAHTTAILWCWEAIPNQRYMELRKAIDATRGVTAEILGLITPEDIAKEASARALASPEIAELAAVTAGTEAKVANQEHRIPKLVEPDGWVVRDQVGSVALQVTGEGATKVGQTEFRTLDDNSPYSFVLRDVTGAVALAVDRSGQVVSGGVGSMTPEVHVFIGAGQSNMSGRGTPAGEEYDPIDSRILQYGSRLNTAGAITPATVPLDMHDAPGGLSPLTAFAREYLRTQPANVSVLLVPAAHGGTAFYTSSETPLPAGYAPPNTGGGTWQYNRAEPVNLYQRMVAQTKAALAAVVSQLGATPKLKGFLWHQGEGDAGRTDQAGYAGHFDAMVTDLRTQLTASTLPVVLGGMSPDMIATTPTMLPIRAAHVDTPRRLTRSAFARAEANTGKYNDAVHFGREGVELLGRSYLEAYKRALANVGTSSPMPPRNVRASYFGGVLTMQFDYPLCRATSFTVEYSMDGGSWVNIPRTVGMDYEASIAGLAGSVAKVRVSTINEVGTSAPSTPITASGA